VSRTKIFVSSTFFDLAQVREDIRNTILQMGHEPLLNEYPSFPVTPNIDTIENCKKAVRSSDFFVLIIGGRRGSLDPVSGKSVTNIEYETAIETGMDCFAFVNEQVMTVLEVWKKTPDADFSAFVDSPQVFEFISGITAAQRWVFTFKRASEISEILRNQLSVFLKDLLQRKREGKLDPMREFLAETPKARQLAQDRPHLWEYRLVEELLRTKLAELSRSCEDLKRGLLFRPRKPLGAIEYLDWIGHKVSEPIDFVQIIKVAMEEDLSAACGKPGEQGNPIQILRAVNKMTNACQAILEWELELNSLRPPSKLQGLGKTLQGITLGVVEDLNRVPQDLSKALEGSWTGTRHATISFIASRPPQIEKFQAEMQRVSEHPEWLRE
jgi:hypothetical protein